LLLSEIWVSFATHFAFGPPELIGGCFLRANVNTPKFRKEAN
jgi:hypothetical protein